MLEDTIVVEDLAKTHFDETWDDGTAAWVVLADAGDKKIQVIKEVRALLNLGLKDAHDLVKAAPTMFHTADSDIAAARLLLVGADAYPLTRGHLETAIGLVEGGAQTLDCTTGAPGVPASVKDLDLRDPEVIARERAKKYTTFVKNKLTVFEKCHTGDTLQSFLDAITCSEVQEDDDAITCGEAQEDGFFARLKYLQSLLRSVEVNGGNPHGPRYDLTLLSPPPTTVRGMGIFHRPSPEECENELRAIWAEMRTYVNELRAMRDTGQCAMTPLNPDYGNNDGRENPNTWVRDEYLAELEELISKGDELSCGAAMTAAVDKIVDSPEHDSWYDWQARHKNGYENSCAVMKEHWSTEWPPDVEKVVVLQDDPDVPAHLEIHYQSATVAPEKLIAEIASQYPTLVFVESHAREFNAWGANVYIDGKKFYEDENWDPSCDDVLEGLVRKLVDAKEADKEAGKEAGNGWDSELHRVMNRWQVVVNRSEADAKAAADLAVNGLI